MTTQGEIRPGFKQTEVGVIPEDWTVKSIAQVVDRVRLGGNYPNSSQPSSKPLIKMGNMGRGDISTRSMDYVPEHFPVDEQHRLSSGDVLFNTRNTLDLVGKICIWRDELPAAYFNSNILRIEFSRSEIGSPLFANYALNTASSVRRLRELATGSTSVAAIYTRDLLKFEFAVPPLPEQQVIAEALADADALIAALEGMITKKHDLKQAAMQHLLTGRIRLPGFSGKWRAMRLGDVAVISKGAQLHSSRMTSSGRFPHYNGGVAPSGYTDEANCAAETVAISEGGNSCGFVNYITSPFWCGGHCYALSFHRDNKLFLYQYLKLRQSDIMGLRVGSGLPNVQKAALSNLLIRLPTDLDEQAAIAEVLSDMDSDLTALEAQAHKARTVKQGMMQELLTGRVRLV